MKTVASIICWLIPFKFNGRGPPFLKKIVSKTISNFVLDIIEYFKIGLGYASVYILKSLNI